MLYNFRLSEDSHEVDLYHKVDNKYKIDSFYYKKLKCINEIRYDFQWKNPGDNNYPAGYQRVPCELNSEELNAKLTDYKELEEGEWRMPSPDTAEKMAKMPNSLLEWVSSKFQPKKTQLA
ncbi:hypothetical protein [Wolbachia endosymbiont of Ctenocephalides felis wCfeT]|uniref:hypothetical protein n=1 Tax=Wolbachia endosymbiont of Ctenocephalides felis wCfeT TaxID=2732593 RepID=UPI0014478361|nr:hypothetical protein [Wolbachia endosymbiont of Ctenocephalides felis wCfeT]